VERGMQRFLGRGSVKQGRSHEACRAQHPAILQHFESRPWRPEVRPLGKLCRTSPPNVELPQPIATHGETPSANRDETKTTTPVVRRGTINSENKPNNRCKMAPRRCQSFFQGGLRWPLCLSPEGREFASSTAAP